MLKLNNIVDKGSIKKSKRVGRGIGSGKGKTSGAGHKGQKSRSGVSIKDLKGADALIEDFLKEVLKILLKRVSIINLTDIDKA